MKHSDFLPSFPRRFVAFASRYRRCALKFAPVHARRRTHGPGIVYRTPPNRFIDGDGTTSQVSGGPHYVRALLFDPGGTSALGHYCALVLSSALLTASTPATNTISRLHHTARTPAVYASQDGLLHRHARLASGWLARLSGRGWLPTGSQRKVSVHLILLSQASPGALEVIMSVAGTLATEDAIIGISSGILRRS